MIILLCYAFSSSALAGQLTSNINNVIIENGYNVSKIKSELKSIYSHLSTFEKTIFLSDLYDKIAESYETEQEVLADALKECYYAIADTNDENLGALYYNDIVIASEKYDSYTIEERIKQLEAYASKNNLDYSQELADARDRLSGVFRKYEFDETSFLEYFRGDEFWVLDTEMLREIDAQWKIPTFLSISSQGYFTGYYSAETPKKRNGRYRMKDNLFKRMRFHVYTTERYEEEKTIYMSWGNERNATAQPVLLAGLRQTVQEAHAMVEGELTREKYSLGEKIGYNALANLVDASANALFDQLSVAKAYVFRREMTITLVNPNLIEGIISFANVEVKSNNINNPKIKTHTAYLRYYRCYTDEDLYLISKDCHPQYSDDMDIASFEEKRRRFKSFEKGWKKARKIIKKKYKRDKFPYENYVQEHNSNVLTELRSRADNYFITND